MAITYWERETGNTNSWIFPQLCSQITATSSLGVETQRKPQLKWSSNFRPRKLFNFPVTLYRRAPFSLMVGNHVKVPLLQIRDGSVGPNMDREKTIEIAMHFRCFIKSNEATRWRFSWQTLIFLSILSVDHFSHHCICGAEAKFGFLSVF